MKTARQACKLRPEVLKGELSDAIFGTEFWQVLEGKASHIYQEPATFFCYTHPAAQLKKIVGSVFASLADPAEAGAVLRLSTGFGGGKTHALIALWHLARHIDDLSLGTELLPAAGRPPRVVVAALDAGRFGRSVCATHPELETHSLWGELAYQLSGVAGYQHLQDVDRPDSQPNAAKVSAMLPDAPVLIMIDELVVYMATLNEQEQSALLAFLKSLMGEIGARRQAVLVITDTAGQAAYKQQADALAQAAAGQRLGEVVKRSVSDFDPIGEEAAQVITRRLFEHIDPVAAHEVSAAYFNAYQRVLAEQPELLPASALEYARRMVTCYPFHPRLLETAQNRLGALQDFQRSRGALRLFGRILRDVWEGQDDVYLISAGDLNWQSSRIQSDLLSRLNRDNFKAAVDADVVQHAGELDATYATDVHRRVASALLLESLPLAEPAAMDKADLTLAVLRPSEVGHEPAEAVDHLMNVCWHLYRDATGLKYQFRYEPNANKIIEEVARTIPLDDARQAVFTAAQEYFRGHTFSLVAYPSSPRAVSDSASLKLVLCDSQSLAQAVCDYEDDSDPAAKRPRRFRNAIFAVAPSPGLLSQAISAAQRRLAAESVAKEHRKGTPVRSQVDDLLPTLTRNAKLAALRAFDRVLFQGRPALTLDEQYLAPREGALSNVQGQARLKDFLDANRLIYQPTDTLDVDLLLELLPGATPSVEHPGAYPASAVYERALASPSLRLFLDEGPLRRAMLTAVERGRLVIRLPEGDVYDQEGRVVGPAGDRRREPGHRLSNLKLTVEVLVALPDAPCVAGWLKVDERGEGEDGQERLLLPQEAAHTKQTNEQEVLDALDAGLLDEARRAGRRYVVVNERFQAWQPARRGPLTVRSWEAALAHAATRPLMALTFSTRRPELADRLIQCAQPFSARRLTWLVRAEGQPREGGQVKFLVEKLPHSSPLKPLEVARRLLQAAPGEASFQAELSLELGEQGIADARGYFEQAREHAADGLELEARFGPERATQGEPA